MLTVGRGGGHGTEVRDGVWRRRGDTEGEKFPHAGDVPGVEDLAHSWRLGADRMADVVGEGVLKGARWIVGWQVGRRVEGTDGEARSACEGLWWWRTGEVGIEMESGRLGLMVLNRTAGP